MKQLFFVATCAAVALSAMGQDAITVDSRQWAFPVVKRLGVNIPATTSYQALVANADALNELGVQYVRLENSWGRAGQGLYDAEETTTFPRTDAIVDLISAAGAQTLFVEGCPTTMGTDFPADMDAWKALNATFAAHNVARGLRSPSYQIFPQFNYSSQAQMMSYAKVYSNAQQGIEQGEARAHIQSRVMPASLINEEDNETMAKTFVSACKAGSVGKLPIVLNAMAADCASPDQFQHRLFYLGNVYEWCNGKMNWEVILTSFNVGVQDDASLAVLTAAINARQASGLTQFYVGQLLDGTDGSQGLISASGAKTPLFYTLKAWNKMPMTGAKTTSTANNVISVASFDANRAAVALFNAGSETNTSTLRWDNLDLTSGSLTKVDGFTGAETALGDMTQLKNGLSMTLQPGELVFLYADAAEPVNYLPIGNILSDHHYYWFKYSEGWAWHYFDPATTTAVLGCNTVNFWNETSDDRGDFGCNNMAVDLNNVPSKIYAEVVKQGDVHQTDENGAIYLRLDYETLYTEDDYSEISYESPVVYIDRENAVFDANHGSLPDAYPGGAVKEQNYAEVDFLTPGGFEINPAEFAPEGWTGNIRVIAYLQNPGSHNAGGCAYSFRLHSGKEAAGIENVVTDTLDGNTDAPRQYFDIQGRRLNSPLSDGITIVRQGSKVSKIAK